MFKSADKEYANFSKYVKQSCSCTLILTNKHRFHVCNNVIVLPTFSKDINMHLQIFYQSHHLLCPESSKKGIHAC